MADLSTPPQTLLAAAPTTLPWPTPALAAYASMAQPGTPVLCCVEGLNGRHIEGELVHFDPPAPLHLKLREPGKPLHLRLDQFRRLHLLEPLAPCAQGPAGAVADAGFNADAVPGAVADAIAPDDACADAGPGAIHPGSTPTPETPATAELLAQRPVQPFAVELKGQLSWRGHTVGHVEDTHGLYLFEPLDDAGQLRRWFVPRAAYHQAEVGVRIGQALVDQHSATPEQIRLALVEQGQLRQRRLGDMLVVRQIITADELHAAIEQQARMPLVRIGEALAALGFITDAQLEDALVQQRSDRNLPLGELLLRQGLVSRADLQTALARKMGYPLVDVDRFPADPQALARLPQAQATRWLALPLLVRSGRLVLALEDPSSRSTMEQLAFAAQCKVVPVLARSGLLLGAIERAYATLARSDAEPVQVLAPGERPAQVATPATAHPSARAAAAPPVHAVAHAVAPAAAPAGAAAPVQPGGAESPAADGPAIGPWLQAVLADARARQSSDIHLECHAGTAPPRVRLRVDGRLLDAAPPPAPASGRAVLAWLKEAAGLPAQQAPLPRQGLIPAGHPTLQAAALPGQACAVDAGTDAGMVPGGATATRLRLTVLPTQDGAEDAVLQLQAMQPLRSPEALGLSPRLRPLLDAAVQPRAGLLLVAGPRGCGVHSTLHALLSTLNTPDRKLCTAEDPVHTLQPGVRQMQVDAQADWNFAHALRALQHADADVVAVGELRDAQTAQLALQAAMAGRLVLSTLPSLRAADAASWLLELGLHPHPLGDTLRGVLAQRLVRQLCPHCRQPWVASAEAEEELLHEHLRAGSATPARGPCGAVGAAAPADAWNAASAHKGGELAAAAAADPVLAGWRRRWGNAIGQLVLHRPVGCSHCQHTGYRGRTGVHEWLAVTPALRAALHAGSRADALHRQMVAEGGPTLMQDGIEKVLSGVTTLSELQAVI